MATIGSLQINLEARTEKLENELKKARSSIARLQNQIKGTGTTTVAAERSITRSFARISAGAGGLSARLVATSRAIQGLAAIVGTTLAGRFVVQTIGATDAIGKMADKIGVGVEALQELRFAASQSGIAQNTLEDSLAAFTRRVGEAASGNKQLLDVFQKQLGVQISLNGRVRDTGALFNAVADAYTGLRSQAEKAQVAQDLFGRSGLSLVNILRLGGKGIDDLRQRARNLGLVLSNETVRAAEKANDQLDIMQRVVRAQLTRAVVSLAPEITKVGESFARIAQALSTSNKEFVQLSAQETEIVDTIQNIGAALRLAGEGAGILLKNLKDIAQNPLRGIPLIGELLAPTPLEPGTLTPRDRGEPETLPGITVRARRLIRVPTPKLPFDKEFGPGTAAAEKMANALNDLFKSSGDEATKALQNIRSEAARFTAEFRTPLEQFNTMRDRLVEIRAVMGPGFETTFQRAMQSIRKEFYRTTLAGESLQIVSEGIKNAFAESFRGVIQGTQTVSQAFNNMVQNIALSLANSLIQRGLDRLGDQLLTIASNANQANNSIQSGRTGSGSNSWINALSGIIGIAGSLFGGGASGGGDFGGGALGGSTGAGSSSGSFAPALTAQHGAVITKPTFAIIGENPANNPEYILNRHQMRKMMQGGGNTYNITMSFPNADVESFRRNESQVLARMQALAARAARRNG